MYIIYAQCNAERGGANYSILEKDNRHHGNCDAYSDKNNLYWA
jgi:hypothetical protein